MRHYKRNWLAVVFLLISTMMFSQKGNSILIELGELLGSKDIPSELFYNVEDRILDIQGYQIKLTFSNRRYEESDGAMLVFQCEYPYELNCIYDPKTNKYFENFAIPMKDKESVYKAINLINALY